MKIVIEVDDIIYKETVNSKVLFDEYVSEVAIAIINGTPLPKNHGRLIDADNLREDFKASKNISFAERMDISCIVDHAPTIIERSKQ